MGDKVVFGYTPVSGEPTAPSPVSEPVTWLLIRSGAALVAVLRKKLNRSDLNQFLSVFYHHHAKYY
jgi:hypothetical protein